MCDSFNESDWFYINNGRAMVSLGPFTDKKTCPYSCAFCYVQDGFITYCKKDIDEIIKYLIIHREEYEIIYISGDTDSFAPPRKALGIKLLEEISCKIDCDLLFTTRTVFSNKDLEKIQKVVNNLRSKNKKLYACISISRFSDSLEYIEPKPIPTPIERIDTLKKLNIVGAVTVLALRPFLPVVPIDDYFSILKEAESFINIVLGETFYFTSNGGIVKRLFPKGIPEDVIAKLNSNKMDFNKNTKEWCTWSSKELETKLSDYCNDKNIVFSMRSKTAIEEYNKLIKN